ncbi:hypothetical protein CEUSTIGMA_g11581.t1 [Chlamydomonas eustigma]|uniref:Glycosyltransferase family 92 protein n=1 Tax=Chlamydomonas eustigma TaxID=1157962 RepID=A0A250XM63_9CHLO|nr:hypothetical protein CEUSTIGMA_g11581.t1 [Chlamydomonas eustigma]|eukprot:GAX84158.1 hypothetical protein CEUSTIGMA_g11581.t1 [Chlamydomonas eustigma]
MRTLWRTFNSAHVHFVVLIVCCCSVCIVTCKDQLPNETIHEKSYSALCAVSKDENGYDIREWIHHHLCLGVGTIYLYDHGSATMLDDLLSDYISSGQVFVHRFEGRHTRFREFPTKPSLQRFLSTAQGYAYWSCLNTHGGSHSFIGFLDVDEFVVINDRKVNSLNGILRDYEQYGAVAFHWRILGSSGLEKRPLDSAASSVVDTYTACISVMSRMNKQIKSFVNTKFNPIMISPHQAVFLKDSPLRLRLLSIINKHYEDSTRRYLRCEEVHYSGLAGSEKAAAEKRTDFRSNSSSNEFLGTMRLESSKVSSSSLSSTSSYPVRLSSIEVGIQSLLKHGLMRSFRTSNHGGTLVPSSLAASSQPHSSMKTTVGGRRQSRISAGDISILNDNTSGNIANASRRNWENDGTSRSPRVSLLSLLFSSTITVNERFEPLQEFVRRPICNRRVSIYHYMTKSKEDFIKKLKRGGGAGNTRSMPFFDQVNLESRSTCKGAKMTSKRFCGNYSINVSST